MELFLLDTHLKLFRLSSSSNYSRFYDAKLLLFFMPDYNIEQYSFDSRKIVDFIDIWSGMHLFNEIDFEI